MKQLIVNADDFGFTRDVNAGIVEAHTGGILTATTLMANGAAFEDAVRLAREHPTLDVGCHLVLVGGESLVDGREFPATVAHLLRAVVMGRVKPYDEMRAQVVKILDSGVAPSHLDTHKHTHLFPPVLDAVVRLAREFKIPWVRRPFDFPLQPGKVPWTKKAISRGLGLISGRFDRVLAAGGCKWTDHFAGFQITGRFDAVDLVGLLAVLPEGSTEFMVHPGRLTDELRSAPTRLKESREAELAALIAPEVRASLEICGVELARYSELRRQSA